MGFLSRIGVGSATVDTVLATDTVQPGDTVEAHVDIEGGDDEQVVEELELAVETEYQVPTDDGHRYETAEIGETELDGFTIEPGDERTIDVPPVEVPETTPATIDRTSVWVGTALEIDWAVDPTDRDELTVRPGPHLDALVTALEDLGLVLEVADSVKSSFGPHEFAQFFEYENHGGAPWTDLDDVEFFVVSRGDRLEVSFTVESTDRSLLGRDESRTRFTVTDTDPDAVRAQVRSAIDGAL